MNNKKNMMIIILLGISCVFTGCNPKQQTDNVNSEIKTENIQDEVKQVETETTSEAETEETISYYSLGDEVELNNIKIKFSDWNTSKDGICNFNYELTNIGNEKITVDNSLFNIYVNDIKVAMIEDENNSDKKEMLDPTRKMKGTFTIQSKVEVGDAVEIQCDNIIWKLDTTNLKYVDEDKDENENIESKEPESTLFENKNIQEMNENEQYEVMNLAGCYTRDNSNSYINLSIYSTFEEGSTVGTVEGCICDENGITMYRFIDEPIEHIKGGKFYMYQEGEKIYFTFEQVNGTYTLNVKGSDAEEKLTMTLQFSS